MSVFQICHYARNDAFAAEKPNGRKGGWFIHDSSFHDWLLNRRMKRANGVARAAIRRAAMAIAILAPLLFTGCENMASAYEAYNRNYERELRAEVGTDGKRIVWSIKPRAPQQPVNLNQTPAEVPQWNP